MSDAQERVRERAYRLWIEEGQPEGRADRHWEAATKIVEEEELGGVDVVDTIAADPGATASRASRRETPARRRLRTGRSAT